MKKDYDLRICTWNVRTLNWEGASIQLADALEKLKADITAIQEMRWTGQGCSKRANCDIYYSCHAERREFGCGFVVSRRLRHHVSISPHIICAHAPTEEKDDAAKDAFYARLEDTYDRCPNHDVKIILGDFNAKVGRERIFDRTVGQFSLHETTSNNGFRLIDFAAARNMVVSSTRFRHLDIHKATWLSPDQKTRNQIDHVVIDGRHASSVMDAAITTDSNSLLHSPLGTAPPTNPLPVDAGGLWAHISHSMRAAAETAIGFKRPPTRNQWYDEECRIAAAAKNAAYRRTLQSAATRATCERYREKRKEERRLFRRKKREKEKRECEELQVLQDRNDARKFYQQVNRLTHGFKTGASNCRDENGNLVTDTQCTLRLWRAHFSKLLAGDDGTNPAIGGSNPIPPIDDNVDIPLPSHDEVRVAIMRLKNNKAAGADGLPAELFKAGGEELIRCMHQLFCRIWLEESMPNDWNLSVLCPVLKKGDPTICTNYRGISLIAISYKVLSSVICERLKPYTSTLIGPYQCGFRPGKSTIDQIFTLRQILEKTHENGIDTHHLFVDYKAAFDSPTRERLYATMSEFGIPAKLIRLCRMTLSSTISSVKLLAYADDIDIIGRSKRDVTAAFSAIEKESAKVGLAVNEGKTKYMLSTSREARRLDSQVVADNYMFEVVKEFTYLGTAINTKNDVSLEIKRRITLANRCYFGLKAWVVSMTDAAALGVFERKILRKIFGPVRIGDDFRIRMNHELY
ncbi:uncharacterized protein LOC132797786 [Drosophila nasuta]|uniref:uncharacterized protein LOC132797786 n=1 Tax=Drosophila nasuta TaxID=42062 RepID=UPI00295EED7D|nr:uncharacterized protein LOC132797786 [Drosophila nasuta]